MVERTMGRKLMWLKVLVISVLMGSVSARAAQVDAPSQRWTAEHANRWYSQQPWLVGANFIPSDAINELEMFQADTFNPALSDKELDMAESIGMNTVRVFLQDQLWKQDPEGFKSRLNTLLTISAKHHIRPILVLFDSCWEANPKLGPQHPAYTTQAGYRAPESPGYSNLPVTLVYKGKETAVNFLNSKDGKTLARLPRAAPYNPRIQSIVVCVCGSECGEHRRVTLAFHQAVNGGTRMLLTMTLALTRTVAGAAAFA